MALVDTWVVYGVNSHSHDSCTIEILTNNNVKILVPQHLAAAHENHGHFAAELSLDFLIGRAYWPTRVSDLRQWCGSCHACQLTAKKRIKSGIQLFEPMAMIGIDWLGPISLPYSINGHHHILILID